jgi:hypothetical protein
VIQAAEFLACRPSTLYSKAAAGLVPRVVLWKGKRKNSIRFDPEQLRAFIKKQSR